MFICAFRFLTEPDIIYFRDIIEYHEDMDRVRMRTNEREIVVPLHAVLWWDKQEIVKK